MGRILNKMYILSGGVTGEDKLSSYRFLTKKMEDSPMPEDVPVDTSKIK